MNHIKVLLIEDNEADYKLISTVIESNDIEIFWLKKVSDVTLSPKAADCDVCLLDLMLPDSGGVDTVKKVRAYFPYMPIVVLSSVRDPRMLAHTLANGAHFYLEKGETEEEHIISSLRNAALIALSDRYTDTTVLGGKIDDLSQKLETLVTQLEIKKNK